MDSDRTQTVIVWPQKEIHDLLNKIYHNCDGFNGAYETGYRTAIKVVMDSLGTELEEITIERQLTDWTERKEPVRVIKDGK